MSQLIYKKMSEVMKDIGPVTKDQKNTAQGFKFRGIDQFVNALHPALVKHGVFMTPRATSFTSELKDVTRSSGKQGVDKHVSILMEYDFFAEDGSKVTVGPIPAEGLDSGDKATNKALSAALKYALIQTFAVPTQDMAEADLETPEIGTSAPKTDKPAEVKKSSFNKNKGVDARSAAENLQNPPAGAQQNAVQNPNGALAQQLDAGDDW
jgi:hypothetical protein